MIKIIKSATILLLFFSCCFVLSSCEHVKNETVLKPGEEYRIGEEHWTSLDQYFLVPVSIYKDLSYTLYTTDEDGTKKKTEVYLNNFTTIKSESYHGNKYAKVLLFPGKHGYMKVRNISDKTIRFSFLLRP
ncbi:MULTISPECIES: hypothetical protein [Lactococcus]|uniref:hypothetical protein n=1 Tax=Lactococcus TaxID=1357 RepID=UPI00203CB545|nr:MULTISPECIES: hypothetical protein [Lactococcus]